MKSTRSLRFSIQRLFLLTIVCLVAVAALSYAVSANKANRAAKARAELAANSKSGINPTVQNGKQQPNAPAAAVITATLTDNVPAATKVVPGGTINYTAVINNTGAASPADDATSLQYSGPLDANTTLVGGSVHASPLAFNDTYNWIGNTALDTSARGLPAVTANDMAVNANGAGDTFTLTAIAGGATALGGTVTLASPSGAFTYNPPLNRPNVGDGASVNDSFTYTITNNADPSLTATGTVTITLTGRVFYLQAGAAGDGRSGTPAGNPATMSTNADKSTDIFYIFSNASSLTGLFTVDAGQQLLGQAVSLVVNIPTLGSVTLFNAAAPTPTTNNGAGNCVTLAGAPGNNTLSGFNIGNCTGGTAITGANVGTLNVSTMTINTNGGALDLTGVGAPTVSVVLGGTTSTGGAKNVNLVGLNGTVTLASGALSGATGNAFDVNGGNATITYLGTISNSGAKQVNIANKTGGSATFDGAISGTGTGINLATNSTSTMTFRGGVVLSTGTNNAFSATGGGTVNVCDENPCVPGSTGALVNTLTTTTGTALNVSATTIGANKLEFRSITSNGGANGIVLSNTGAGGLTVSGTGGSCTSAATCTGGSIQNKTADSISLNTASNISLTNMFVFNSGGSHIDAATVNGLTLVNMFADESVDHGFSLATVTNLTVTGGTFDRGGLNNTACNFDGFHVTNLLGTSSITGATFKRSNTRQFFLVNTAATNFAGTPDQLTVSNNQWNTHNVNLIPNNTPCSGDHLSVSSDTGGNFRLIVNNTGGANVFKTGGIAVQASGAGTNGKLDAQISGITSGGTIASGDTNTAGVVVAATGTSAVTFDVFSNTTLGTGSTALIIRHFTNGTIVGKLRSNTVTHIAGAGTDAVSVINQGDGSNVSPGSSTSGNGTGTVTVASNNVSGNVQRGIYAQSAFSNGTFNLTINNNTVNATDPTGLQGIFVETGGSGAGSGNDICLNEFSNNVTVAAGMSAYRIVSRGVANCTIAGGCTFALQNFAGNGSSLADVQTWITTTKSNTGLPIVATLTQPVVTSAGCAVAPIPNPVDESANRVNDRRSSASLVAQATTDLPKPKMGIASEVKKTPVTATRVVQLSSKDSIASVLAKTTPKASAAEVARIYHSERVLSHHAARNMFKLASQDPSAPASGEIITLNSAITLPAGKSFTIKYSATVNSPPLARQVSTLGTVSGNGPGAFSVTTTDPGPPVFAGATVTLVDTLMTWNGVTSTDWNTATNWTPPAGGTQYAPGVSNPAVNDVVIPNVGNQPTISATDIGIFSMSLANGRTLTITNPRVLTIGGSPGGDLTLDGIISGGNLNLGTGTHVINNAGGTGSLSSTNIATVLSGSTVTLNNNVQAGALAVNAGGSMIITNRTLSLNGSGAALVVPGGATFTTTGSTVVFNGTAAQQAAGVAYNNLTINNTIGLNVTGVTLTGNATLNGALALTSSDLDTGAFTLSQPNTTASTGVSDVVGTITRTAAFGTTTITFGNPNNQITFGAAGTKPTALTVVLAKAAPATYAAAVQRNYTISQTGSNTSTAVVRLHYLDSELNGNLPETSLGLRRLRTGDNHWVAAPPPPGVPTRDGSANWIEGPGVAGTDLPTQWTFSILAPTASDGTVTGRIVDDHGMPVEGAVVRLEGTQNRKFITDANGVYRFDNVQTNGFYTVTPSRANYSFNPSVRSFTQLGESTEAAFGATLMTSHFVNPLDTPEYFVRQHYIDFLGREPDEAGFNFWSNQILECGGDVDCTSRRRENVSAAYFLSIEFQQTGGLVDGMYRAAYGARPEFVSFMPDTRTVGQGVIVGREGWQALLQSNKEAFANAFVNRAAFHQQYDGMDNALFVDTLISHTGVSFTMAERDALVGGLANGGQTRAEVVRSIAENSRFVSAKFNDTFVMMEYMGYLRRDADASGFAFWLNKLNEFNGNFEQAEMVKAFIVSGEFRDRFPR